MLQMSAKSCLRQFRNTYREFRICSPMPPSSRMSMIHTKIRRMAKNISEARAAMLKAIEKIGGMRAAVMSAKPRSKPVP
jgi:hypothetical protein